MSFIKENGGPMVVGAAVLATLIGYIELRAPQMVSAEMDKRGLVQTGAVASIKEDVEDLQATHAEDTAEWKRRVEKIVDILLEE
jgi:hypothetical protein